MVFVIIFESNKYQSILRKYIYVYQNIKFSTLIKFYYPINTIYYAINYIEIKSKFITLQSNNIKKKREVYENKKGTK